MKPNDKAIEAARAAILHAKVALDAAYAAQFQSEDYAGLVDRLRSERGCIASSDDCLAAADALETVLVEREAWKGRQKAAEAILTELITTAIRSGK